MTELVRRKASIWRLSSSSGSLILLACLTEGALETSQTPSVC